MTRFNKSFEHHY